MDSNLTARLDAVQRTPRAATLRPDRTVRAEEWKRKLGATIEHALAIANVTKQEASHRMGYSDHSSLCRWISGAETPQLDKLWAIEELRQPLLIALARLAGADVSTTIIVRSVA